MYNWNLYNVIDPKYVRHTVTNNKMVIQMLVASKNMFINIVSAGKKVRFILQSFSLYWPYSIVD